MLNVLLAQQATSWGDLISLALPFIIIIAAFYFFIIMPQQREEKRRKKLIESLKRGDKVLTESGILGSVVDAKDNIVVLEISPGVRVSFMKWAIRETVEEKKDGKKD